MRERRCALRTNLPEPRAARRSATLADWQAAKRSMQGLVLWFPGPRSETGEDMAELQLHGGRAVVAGVFRGAGRAGSRLAEPGEFIRRAFQNGKLDLTAVEGLADLIAAETEVQRRQAMGQAGGALSGRRRALARRLLDLRAEIEARLDFSDESDVGEACRASAADRGAQSREIAASARRRASGERVREGLSRGNPGPAKRR